MAEFRLADIALHLEARLVGDGQRVVTSLGSLATATASQLSHLSSPSYRKFLTATRACAVLLREDDLPDCPVDALVVANPYLAFARASQLFALPDDLPSGRHPTAIVAASAEVHPTACIGAGVIIGANSTIGAGVRIHPGVTIGERCNVAQAVELYARVVLYSDVRIGARSIVHAGAILGGDGFGFAPDSAGRLHAIAQLGGLSIGEDVSVGCNTAIDRGAIDDTVIEDGVKIDNLVQIGHNCHIGAHSVLCGFVGLAGSSRIGRHCVLAGGSGVGGDQPVTLCDQVTLTAATIVTSSIDKPGVYSGLILHNSSRRWKRNALHLQKLDELVGRVRALERQLAKRSS